MDNCAIRHVDEVTDLIKQTGALVYWLPPYLPDMNPIELAFVKAKGIMRAMESEVQVLGDIDTIVYSAFSCITPDDCVNWISETGIYVALECHISLFNSFKNATFLSQFLFSDNTVLKLLFSDYKLR